MRFDEYTGKEADEGRGLKKVVQVVFGHIVVERADEVVAPVSVLVRHALLIGGRIFLLGFEKGFGGGFFIFEIY